MKSNIYSKMEKLFNADIVQIAQKYNYSDEIVLILKNDVQKLKESYPQTYSIIDKCTIIFVSVFNAVIFTKLLKFAVTTSYTRKAFLLMC